MFNFGISMVTGMGLSGIRGFIFYLMHVLPMYFFFFFFCFNLFIATVELL